MVASVVGMPAEQRHAAFIPPRPIPY